MAAAAGFDRADAHLLDELVEDLVVIVLQDGLGDGLQFLNQLLLGVDAGGNGNDVVLDLSQYACNELTHDCMRRLVPCSGKVGLRGTSAIRFAAIIITDGKPGVLQSPQVHRLPVPRGAEADQHRDRAQPAQQGGQLQGLSSLM